MSVSTPDGDGGGSAHFVAEAAAWVAAHLASGSFDAVFGFGASTWHIVMAYVVRAYIVMACIVTAFGFGVSTWHIVMAYIVMDFGFGESTWHVVVAYMVYGPI